MAEPTTAEAAPSDLGFSAGMFEDVPHQITDDMSADACPFLNMASSLGLEGDSLNRIMRAFFTAFELSDENAEAVEA
ncbi:MAG: hypothetical protein ACKVVT_08870 [Dehalococcoidia bacterium]